MPERTPSPASAQSTAPLASSGPCKPSNRRRPRTGLPLAARDPEKDRIPMTSTAAEERFANPPARDLEETDCCVVGGGPAGVMLTLFLARWGIPVKPPEAHQDFDRQ